MQAAFLAASFFLLHSCQPQQERLHKLMQAGTATIAGFDTLQLADSLFPVVTVSVGTQLQQWLIDTALPCLSANVSGDAVLVPLINAAGDTLATAFGMIPLLRLGGSTFQEVGSGLLTDSLWTVLQQKNIQGIIGANLMQHSTWHFDFERKYVIIAPWPEPFIGLPQTIAIPFNRSIYRSPKWQVQFNRFPYQLVMQVSTGYAGGILLDQEFSNNYKSFMYDRTLQTHSFPDLVHGIASGEGLQMDSLRIERQHTFDNLPVVRSQSSYALLGLAFLRRYRLTIDWRQRMIWLHPAQRGSIKSHRLP
ncbi:MAG: hypothetical protein RMJ87_05095 [Cytophagales bacterium]|nr:hypothetical protein [Bernardetiaceae bacterium]MDW8204385.1 hypothetical protein [Cytophagales bacterium]